MTQLQSYHLDLFAKAEDINQSPEVKAEFIDETKKVLEHHQKLIRLDDTSPLGWATVQRHETNELIYGSDDKKRITQAEGREQESSLQPLEQHNQEVQRNLQPSYSY